MNVLMHLPRRPEKIPENMAESRITNQETTRLPSEDFSEQRNERTENVDDDGRKYDSGRRMEK